MNRVITALVVVAVVAVGVVAAVDGFGGDSTAAGDRPSRDDSASRDLVGPHSPEPGALPGSLVVARGDDCVIQLIDLERLRFSKSGPESGCDFSVSPDGTLAAVVSAGQDRTATTRQFELVSLDGRPDAQGGLGLLDGDPAWSPDGTALAACDPRAAGDTTVVSIEGETRETWHGCWPVYAADGRVVTRTAVDLAAELATDGIYADGEEVVTLPQLLEANETQDDALGFVLGHTTDADGSIAVSIVYASRDGEAVASLQLWRDETDVTLTEIPLFLVERGIPERVTTGSLRDEIRLSPSGREVGITLNEGAGPLFVIDLESGEALGPFPLHGYDWSPDGRWLAVASGAGIDVYGPARDDEPTFQLPLVTLALAWR